MPQMFGTPFHIRAFLLSSMYVHIFVHGRERGDHTPSFLKDMLQNNAQCKFAYPDLLDPYLLSWRMVCNKKNQFILMKTLFHSGGGTAPLPPH